MDFWALLYFVAEEVSDLAKESDITKKGVEEKKWRVKGYQDEDKEGEKKWKRNKTKKVEDK